MLKKITVTMAVLFSMNLASAIPCLAAPSIFSDIPAEHWSYDCIRQLSKTGLMEGNKDTAFQDGRTLTRYEMTLLVGRALTKLDKADAQQKVLIEKLAKEFKDELKAFDTRDTRTVKEETKNKLNIHFEQRIWVSTTSLKKTDGGGYPIGNVADSSSIGERLRVFINQNFGEDFGFTARLNQAKSNINRSDTTGSLTFDKLYVTNRNVFGGVLDIGRMGLFPGKGGVWSNTANCDGFTYSKKVNNWALRAGSGRMSALPGSSPTEYRFAEATYNIDKSANIGAYHMNHGADLEMNVVHGKFGIGNGMAVNFEWAQNQAAGKNYNGKSGYWIALNSRAATADFPPMNYFLVSDINKVHDSVWGLSYRHFPAGMAGQYNRGAANTFMPFYQDSSTGLYLNAVNDVNAVEFDYYYTLKKNLIMSLFLTSIDPIHGSWHDNTATVGMSWVF